MTPPQALDHIRSLLPAAGDEQTAQALAVLVGSVVPHKAELRKLPDWTTWVAWSGPVLAPGVDEEHAGRNLTAALSDPEKGDPWE